MNILEFIEDPQLLNDKSLSPAQKMALKSTYGLPLTMEEERLFLETTGRLKYVPGVEQTECTFILGRRSGKSDKLASTIALFEACCRQQKFSVGEIPICMVVSSELQRQSRIVFTYILRKLERSPILSKMIKNVKVDEIELTNGVLIQCYPCSAARIRGASLACFVGDECAFWKVEGKDVDKQVLDAARPGLSFEYSKLVKISTPNMMRGEIWSDFRQYHGQDSAPVLVVQGETAVFNPHYSRLKLAAARLKDPVVYETEFLARFRADLSAMFDPLVIDRAVNFDRPLELPFRSGYEYLAFVDVAGGGGKDSYAIAVGHKEGERVIVDVVRSRPPKFNPDEVTAQYCELLKFYKIGQCTGDKFGGDFPSNLWMKHGGIHYERSEKTKSELYIESESVFNTERVSLPNRPSLLDQLKLLIRKAHSGGHDSVDSDSNQLEDEANVACGLIWLLSKSDAIRDDLTKIWTPVKPRPALSDIEQVESSFLDELAGRRFTVEELEDARLMKEIEEEEKQLEKELEAEGPRSVGYIRHGWK